jgi:spore coat protein H
MVGLLVSLGCTHPVPGQDAETTGDGETTDGDGDGDGETGDGDGDGDGEPDGPGSEYIFDQNELRTYELEIAPADWATLNQDPTAEIYVPGTLHFEGQSWPSIGVRYKGGYGSLYFCFDGQGNQTCDKLSMKLDFTEYDDDAPLFYGLKHLNLHAMSGAGGGDVSKLHDRVGYNLFIDNGVIAPRVVHARLLINGELIGLYIAVEQIDGRFADHRFPDDGDGNVYKEVWPVHLWEDPYLFALETNEDQNPSAAKMVAFATQLANAGDAGFNAVIEQWMDADALMRYIAVDRAIENWDGIVGLYGLPAGNHNYYWYEETLTNRMWLIPWDLDHTFDYPNPMVAQYGEPVWNEVPQSCAGIPVFADIYRYPAMCDDFIRRIVTERDAEWKAAAQSFLDTLYTQEALDGRVDFYANQIDAAVQEDPDLDYAQWQIAVDILRANMLGLRDQLQAQIDG